MTDHESRALPQIESLPQFSVLVGCMNLRELNIIGNPVCMTPNHRQVLLSVVPQLNQLDGESKERVMAAEMDMETAQHVAAERLRWHDAVPKAGGNRALVGGERASTSNQQQMLLHTPRVDAAMMGYYERQEGRQGTGHQQQQQQRQPVNWQQQGGGGRRGVRSGWEWGGEAADSMRTDQLIGTGSGGKIYIVDAAVQTIETSSAQVRQLQADSKLLKEQMIKLTGKITQSTRSHNI